jgi:Zn finger protein HypA/HybF involved in hydrogenase expression
VHDTHLIEKIYESLAEICRRNAIVRVNALHIEVDEGSHITEPLSA